MCGGGELRAREVVEAALERIEGVDRSSTRSSRSTPTARWPTADAIEPGDERPFAGVPIAIKANTPVAGLRMNFGSKLPRRPPRPTTARTSCAGCTTRGS